MIESKHQWPKTFWGNIHYFLNIQDLFFPLQKGIYIIIMCLLPTATLPLSVMVGIVVASALRIPSRALSLFGRWGSAPSPESTGWSTVSLDGYLLIFPTISIARPQNMSSPLSSSAQQAKNIGDQYYKNHCHEKAVEQYTIALADTSSRDAILHGNRAAAYIALEKWVWPPLTDRGYFEQRDISMFRFSEALKDSELVLSVL